MRLVVRLFVKSLKEQLREPLVLGGTLLMGAAFMVIFGLAMGKGLYTHRVAVLEHDQGLGAVELIRAIEEACYPDGTELFATRQLASA
ncbi:MAG: hypothetical protein JW751_02440 [Polyangiaceae bacterium]|nr:hypothetical protein [Polyangiaceae bacterium]